MRQRIVLLPWPTKLSLSFGVLALPYVEMPVNAMMLEILRCGFTTNMSSFPSVRKTSKDRRTSSKTCERLLRSTNFLVPRVLRHIEGVAGGSLPKKRTARDQEWSRKRAHASVQHESDDEDDTECDSYSGYHMDSESYEVSEYISEMAEVEQCNLTAQTMLR
ncbi:hypothetical protein IW261DRAFT_848842 [Armillaria novae-zelandiae]|uniref:Uncharacterized protein n=1 Tax=Armillaria novae-zelandiae TaxID=153914 RepID=A0AA39PIS0_9AGAR|nr:hypothetical protein IW261DRAFT_848842 [Armillaria novae-zelandiae]